MPAVRFPLDIDTLCSEAVVGSCHAACFVAHSSCFFDSNLQRREIALVGRVRSCICNLHLHLISRHMYLYLSLSLSVVVPSYFRDINHVDDKGGRHSVLFLFSGGAVLLSLSWLIKRDDPDPLCSIKSSRAGILRGARQRWVQVYLVLQHSYNPQSAGPRMPWFPVFSRAPIRIFVHAPTRNLCAFCA